MPSFVSANVLYGLCVCVVCECEHPCSELCFVFCLLVCAYLLLLCEHKCAIADRGTVANTIIRQSIPVLPIFCKAFSRDCTLHRYIALGRAVTDVPWKPPITGLVKESLNR